MEFVRTKISQNPVFVFSKSFCPYCKTAKGLLDSIGVRYEVEEIEDREDCSEIQDALEQLTGARSIPRVFVSGDCIGGCSETQALHKQNKLLPLLKNSGAQFK